MQRILLFAGLIWLFLGISVSAVLRALSQGPLPGEREPLPPQFSAFGLIPIGIGLAHLVVYFVERREARRLEPPRQNTSFRPN